MKHFIYVPIIAYACVGISALLGRSEESGLFGAIIGVGLYVAHGIGEKK